MCHHMPKDHWQWAERGLEVLDSNLGYDVFIIEAGKEHRVTKKCWLSLIHPSFLIIH